MAYVPPDHRRPITVDMTAMSGPSRARWFDPTSGAYTAIGSDLPNTGTRAFTTPGNNSVGQRDWVLVLDFDTGPDVEAPTAPGSAVATAVDASRIDVSWTPAMDNTGVTGYRVERCAGAGCATFAQVAAPAGTTCNSDTALTAETTYRYRVRAADAAGNLGPYGGVGEATTTAPDTTPPTSPGAVTATPVSGSRIDLNWGAATDDVGVTGYRVERCAGPGCATFVQVATPSGTAYSDTGLAAGTTYRYRLRATDAAGNLGPISAVGEATTTALDTTPPTSPGAVTATPVSESAIDVSWDAATDNVGVTGYRVERCAGPGCASFVQVATPSGTAYSDTGLAAGTTYRYRVRAADAAGNVGAYSSAGEATTLPGTSSGPVAAYAFDEGTGGTVADASGHGLSGTIVGATWTAAGKFGEALSFNGNGNYVDLGNPAGLRLTGSMTWSAWVYATGTPADDGQIIAKSGSGGGNLGWQFKTSPDTGPHTFGVAVSSNGSVHTQRYSATVRQLNTWYHVAGVYDAAARTLNIYVNGVLDNGTLSGTVPASQFDPAENVTIGRRDGGFYFRRPHRRGARLRPGAVGRGNPGGHVHAAGGAVPGHAGAHRARDADGDAGERRRDRRELGRGDGQRRYRGLPRRALPGRRVRELRGDREPVGDRVQRHRAGGRDDLPVSDPGRGRGGQPGRLFERGGGHDAAASGHGASIGSRRRGGSRGERECDRRELGRGDGQRRREPRIGWSGARAPAARASRRSRRPRAPRTVTAGSRGTRRTGIACAPKTPPGISGRMRRWARRRRRPRRTRRRRRRRAPWPQRR